MKHRLELTNLIADIRLCAIDTQKERLAQMEQRQTKGVYSIADWDITPYIRTENDFWELWNLNHIDKRIQELANTQFFDDEPINEYQTEQRINLLNGFIDELFELGGYCWEFLHSTKPLWFIYYKLLQFKFKPY